MQVMCDSCFSEFTPARNAVKQGVVNESITLCCSSW